MDLDELRRVRRQERETDSLQHLRDDFYEDVAAYIRSLKSERDEAAATADDPFSSPEVRRLTDEIDAAEEVAEAIYEQRVGKVVKLASFAAADMTVDEGGMTRHEQALFADLVDRIRRNKSTVLDVLAGERPAAGGEQGTGPRSEAPSRSERPSRPGAERGVSDEAGDAAERSPTPPEPDAEPPSDSRPPADPQSADDAPPAPPEDVLAEAMGGDRTPGGDADTLPDDSGADVRDDAAGEESPNDGPRDGSSAEDPTPDGGPTAAGADAGAGASTREDANAVGGGQGQGQSTGGGADRETVRITRDVGAILGADEREYDLQREDVVTLPAVNAEPLVERDAAERID